MGSSVVAYTLRQRDRKLLDRLFQQCQDALVGVPEEHCATFLMLAYLPDHRKVLDLLYKAKVFFLRKPEHAATLRAIDVWIAALVEVKAKYPAEVLGRRAMFQAFLDRLKEVEVKHADPGAPLPGVPAS